MKRMIICAAVAGVAMVGVAYWMYKKEKKDSVVIGSVENEPVFDSNFQVYENTRDSNVEELNHSKSESVQDIYERHTAASEIMKDAYKIIMEDFVEDFQNEKNGEFVIDNKDVSVMKEIDLISDELDDLLK